MCKTRITDLDDLKHRIRTEWTKLRHVTILQLCVSGVAVFQLVSGWAVVISSTAFNSDIFAITAAFEAFVLQSNRTVDIPV